MRDFLNAIAGVVMIAGLVGLMALAEAQTPLSSDGAVFLMVLCFTGWFFLWENYVVRAEKEAAESERQALYEHAFDALEPLPTIELIKLKVLARRLFTESAISALDKLLWVRTDLDNGGDQEG